MSYKFGTKEQVDGNHQRFFAKHGINPHKVVYMQQVHGDRIGVVKRPQLRKNTDGLITKTPNLWLAVYHADCIPLFFIDESSLVTPGVTREGVVALGVAHVGWRGVVAGLPRKMVGEMVKHFKCAPSNITVKFGPFICSKHYDVASDDERTKLLPTVTLENGRLGLDLESVMVTQLKETGIMPENIERSQECTAEHPDTYWSYHHTKEKIGGVMVSVIGLS
ncbi:laccase domain-containing protein [Candidatus Berkelbacteria bacterium]|nr:laccase domain-containing protein [Candidatus Berkelbacteria bacterium]